MLNVNLKGIFMSLKKVCWLVVTAIVCSSNLCAQYISEVLEYKPAPGQFINDTTWGLPQSANSIIGTTTGALSLGAFGGYVVFRFENPVQNNPDNPFGVDFTIFGNPSLDWSEPGVVFVMKDENNNGLPDDVWYELAGSDYFFSSTKKDYQVQYFNPHSAGAANVPWTDNYEHSGTIFPNGINLQPYYPLNDSFPAIGVDNYTLSGTLIEGKIDTSKPAFIKSFKRAFGYADNQFRGAAPYTLPDNPYTNEKENAGGDAFDIDWAVDENGNYVSLDCIHFVKVQTAMAKNAARLGEISTEITGAVVVEPSGALDGIMDLIVIKDLPDTISMTGFQLEAFAFHKGKLQTDTEIVWSSSDSQVTINDDKLNFGLCGILPLTITASLKNNPDISASASTIINSKCGGISFNDIAPIEVYPNPAKDFIKLNVEDDAEISIFDVCGKVVLNEKNYRKGQSINIQNLSSGVYVVNIHDIKNIKTKLIISK